MPKFENYSMMPLVCKFKHP